MLTIRNAAALSLIALLASTGCGSRTSNSAYSPDAPPPNPAPDPKVEPVHTTSAPAATNASSTSSTLPPSARLASIMQEPEIRVAVARDLPELRLQSDTGVVLRTFAGQEVARLQPGQDLPISNTLLRGGLQAQGNGSWLKLNGKETAPKIMFTLSPNNGVLAIAHLPLEEYLSGVLAGEVPFERWPSETLKAQAVVSRSYALYEIKQHEKDTYDVEATIMSQVFRAGYRNNPILRAAVDGTRGQVITAQGRLFPAYFHSNSGGRTAPVEAAFPDRASSTHTPPLSGTDDPFSLGCPNARWKAQLDQRVLLDKLNASPEFAGKKLAQFTNLEFFPGTKNSLGRAETVRVTGTLLGGKPGPFASITLPANRFRLLAGPGDLKSVWIERLAFVGNTLEFEGRGFGHGVGMSQWGSSVMGQRGYKCDQILGFYYPGAELTRLYAAPGPLALAK